MCFLFPGAACRPLVVLLGFNFFFVKVCGLLVPGLMVCWSCGRASPARACAYLYMYLEPWSHNLTTHETVREPHIRTNLAKASRKLRGNITTTSHHAINLTFHPILHDSRTTASSHHTVELIHQSSPHPAYQISIKPWRLDNQLAEKLVAWLLGKIMQHMVKTQGFPSFPLNRPTWLG